MTTMMQVRFDPVALVRLALAQGIEGDDDAGYTVHAALEALLGPLAPKVWRADRVGGDLRCLGYTDATASDLTEQARGASDLARATCDISDLAKAKPVPAIEVGRRLGYSVRVFPTSRQGGRCERDAAGEGDDRAAVYAGWLGRRIGGAADLESVSLVEVGRVRTLRRQGSAGKRFGRSISLPVAGLEGTLVVRDAAAFAEVVRCGIGRHRAFGAGMLLLRRVG